MSDPSVPAGGAGPDDIRRACDGARLVRDHLLKAVQLQEALITGLEGCLEAALQRGLDGPSIAAPMPGPHRRDHRPGRPAILAEDPELRAFAEVRMGRVTFDQIAAAVADPFPPGRRIGKSALHAGWHTHRKRITAGLPLG
jgi:hypothetical protein